MGRRQRKRQTQQTNRPLAIVNEVNTQAVAEKVVAELIGRTTSPFRRTTHLTRQTFDNTYPDYRFYSWMRRGKEPGYRLGALFAKRLCEIDAEWTIGSGFTVSTDNEELDDQLADFIKENLHKFMTLRKDANGVGDAYVIVNADASLTMVNPDTVEIITDPLDYTTITAYRITTTLQEATIVDEYRVDGRTVTLTIGGKAPVIQNYPNLIGMIPVIHLANDKETNEIYGHPIYDALITLFARYDDVLQKSLDGVEIMGRPIPVAEGLKDPELAKQENSTRTEDVMDRDGNLHTVPVVDFEDLTMLWLGEGATFKFAAPGSFSADTVAMLKKMFYLMLEHTGIPEWVWGGAVASSMASVEAQKPAFIHYLEGRRIQLECFLLELFEVYLATLALSEPVPAYEDLEIEWPELNPADEQLLLEKIKYADGTNKVTPVTALRLMDLVENPEEEIREAEQLAADDEANLQAEIDSMMKNGGNKAIVDKYDATANTPQNQAA